MKPHVFRPAADTEYTRAAAYYARIAPELGGRFYDEIEGLIRDVRRQPDRFRTFDPPARRHFSAVFPYAIVYVDQPERIWILAVMHASGVPAIGAIA